ncbi:MAG: hypothetical protein K0Q55_3256, partial [Verrucomicrobia bacterium]|nr:hypothetical protein [Verrucomicrobiota bacterium]
MPQHTDPKPTLWNIAGIRPFWFVLVLVVALVIFLGWNWGKKQYGEQQQGHLLAQAKAAEAKGDYRSSLLSLRRVLQLEPDNVEAVRMLALQADRFNSPTALQWMQRLADLEPNNQTNLVLWAKCAMRQNELMVADQVLQRFPKDQRETLTYHRLAGAFAIHIRKYQAAEFHFGKALKLNPSSPHEQLNLATIRLLSAKPEIVSESRATLEKLMTSPELGREAAQALLTDHVRQKNTAKQLELAKKISQMPGSRFTDQLTYLDLLRRNQDSRFNTELNATKQFALQNMQNASELVAWMNAREQVQDAYTWAMSLPEKDRATPALALSIAESQIKLKKWEELYNSTAKADWQELDFLRLAFLARAQREMNLWGSSRSSWRQA